MATVTSKLVLGEAWEGPVETFRNEAGTAVNLSGRTLTADWRAFNTKDVLLTVSTSDGGLVVNTAASGTAHFDLTADQTETLKGNDPDAYPGGRRRFDVRVYDETNGDFVSNLEIVAIP